MNAARRLVWDVPTRLFHWSLVLLVALQFASGEFEAFDMQWHVVLGGATLALLLFRFAWGILGSDSARFTTFLHSPRTVWHYLRGGKVEFTGHNPLGGLSVATMLTLLVLVAFTGLASSDDIDLSGPLADHLDTATVRFATRWHHRLTTPLLWLIGLHVIAVLFHELRGHRLIAALFHGHLPGTGAAPRRASTGRAAVLMLLSAALVWLLYRLSRG